MQYCTNLDFLEIRACKLMPPVEAPEVSANGLALAVKVVVEVLHSSHVPMRCSSPVNHDAFMCVQRESLELLEGDSSARGCRTLSLTVLCSALGGNTGDTGECRFKPCFAGCRACPQPWSGPLDSPSPPHLRTACSAPRHHCPHTLYHCATAAHCLVRCRTFTLSHHQLHWHTSVLAIPRITFYISTACFTIESMLCKPCKVDGT